MNRLFITGNLTADPVTNAMQDGREVCNFTVAVNRRKTQRDQNPPADFFRVSAWNELGKTCQRYLSKGKKVTVVGPVSVGTYTANDGSTRASANVLAQDVEFLSPRTDGEQEHQAEPEPQPSMTPVNVDGELPF